MGTQYRPFGLGPPLGHNVHTQGKGHHVAHLVHLPVGAISYDLDKLEDPRWVLVAIQGRDKNQGIKTGNLNTFLKRYVLMAQT